MPSDESPIKRDETALGWGNLEPQLALHSLWDNER
jgi:hypothetical protein